MSQIAIVNNNHCRSADQADGPRWRTRLATTHTHMAMEAWVAVSFCVATTIAFVGSLYLWPNPHLLDRDHPTIIKRRLVSVVAVSLVGTSVLWTLSPLTVGSLATSMGLVPPCGACVGSVGSGDGVGEVWEELDDVSWGAVLGGCGLPFVSALILPLAGCVGCFAGPLVMEWMDQDLPGMRNYPLSHLGSWISIRNLVVAPVAEEYVFRALFMAALSQAGFSPFSSIALPPLLFGMAHLHFVLDGRSLASLGLQLGYTSIFGAFSGLLFHATSSLYPPILVHAFCNFMGFPDFDALLSHKHKHILIPVLLAGVVVFFALFSTITSRQSYLYPQSRCS